MTEAERQHMEQELQQLLAMRSEFDKRIDALEDYLAEAGVATVWRSRIVAVDERGVTVRHRNGRETVLEADSAFVLMALKPSPGGSISPFCEQPTVTSTPHSSCR